MPFPQLPEGEFQGLSPRTEAQLSLKDRVSLTQHKVSTADMPGPPSSQ